MHNSNDGPDHHLNCAFQITHRDEFYVHMVQNTIIQIIIQIAQFKFKFKLRTFALV